MIIPRETGSSYYDKPQVQMVYYFRLTVESKEDMLVRKKMRRSEAIPEAVAFPIFLRRWTADSLFRGFLSLLPPIMTSQSGPFV
jgi:hypothetical protein